MALGICVSELFFSQNLCTRGNDNDNNGNEYDDDVDNSNDDNSDGDGVRLGLGIEEFPRTNLAFYNGNILSFF